jgi:hypothetical protein
MHSGIILTFSNSGIGCKEGKLTSNIVGPLAALRYEDNPKQIAWYLQDDRIKWAL